jgi:presenilin-like A22 family membrane protease
MKHELGVTLALVLFFILAQIVGLVLIKMDIGEIQVIDGIRTIIHGDTTLGPRPEMTGLGTFAYIAAGLVIGTLLVLLIIKMKKINLWKAWFFLAVFMAISLSLGVLLNVYVAFIVALVLSILKIMKPNVIIHNLTEILMYAGIGVFLVPLLTVFWAIMLLIAISLYDIYAVFKSKHMVKMAKFQAQSQVFAGLFIPYTPKNNDKSISIQSDKLKMVSPPGSMKSAKADAKSAKTSAITKESLGKKNAILGGGDIAFPLLFTGAVMENLIVKGLSQSVALQQSLIITMTTTIALAALFVFAKKDKFYPAMPIVTAGCLIGYGIVMLL